MEYQSLLLQSQFNNLYSDVVNCEIKHNPHYTGRVPFSFFFEKRPGLKALYNYNYTDILDTYFDGTAWYMLATGADDLEGYVILSKDGIVLKQSLYIDGIDYKFLTLPSVKGEPFAVGTGDGQVTVDGVEYMGASGLTTDIYQGKWLYIYDADVGTGVVTQIESNDATHIYPLNGFYQRPVNADYQIYDTFGEALAFIWVDGLYVIHSDTNIQPALNMTGTVGAVNASGYLYFYDVQGNVSISNGGINILGINANSYIGSRNGILSICEFQKYIVLFSNERIDVILPTNVSITINTGDGQQTIQKIQPIITNATTQFGIHNRGAFCVYNQGLYIFSSKNKFIGLSLTAVAENQYTVTTQDQGIYMQKQFDLVVPTDNIRVDIDENEINVVLYRASTESSKIFKYDFLYQAWHFWKTDLPIKYMYKHDYYIGARVYDLRRDGVYIDGAAGSYTQIVRAHFGEDTIFTSKRLIVTKIYFGAETSAGAYLKTRYFLAGIQQDVNVLFTDSQFLQNIADYGLQGELRNNYGGYGEPGDDTENYAHVAPTSTSEVATGLFGEMFILEFIATGQEKLSLGGVMLGYDKVDVPVTPILESLGSVTFNDNNDQDTYLTD